MTVKRFLKSLVSRITIGAPKFPMDVLCWRHPVAIDSFAQSGEDVLLKLLFDALSIKQGIYVDIGANDPAHFSNTYLLYRNGWSGICIEPQMLLADRIKSVRPRDVVVNKGLGISNRTLTFYEIHPHTLSTFDSEVAKRYAAMGHAIIREVPIPVVAVADFLSEYPAARAVDLVSIDIEGDEASIIREFVKRGVRPKVIVCETRTYSPKLGARREQDKIDSLLALGYEVYADTYINTIFLDRACPVD
jgi:FkbM family methyltransferase